MTSLKNDVCFHLYHVSLCRNFPENSYLQNCANLLQMLVV